MEDVVIQDIINLVAKFAVERVILFGSRARGDHSSRSDYDLAIFGEHLSSTEQVLLSQAVDEIKTLKKIDLVFLTSNQDSDFVGQIIEEGVIIYEQVSS